MNNSDMPAMPQGNLELLGAMEPEGVSNVLKAFGGLTKREHFAGLAMQGLLANDSAMSMFKAERIKVSSQAIIMADELLKALEANK